jgi:hypothetical protein
MLKHRSQASESGSDTVDGGSRLAGVLFRRVAAPFASQAFFALRIMTLLVLMPEWMQSLFVDDFLKGVAIIGVLVSSAASQFSLLEIILTSVAIGGLMISGFVYCCICHKRHEDIDDSDDEDEGSAGVKTANKHPPQSTSTSEENNDVFTLEI